MIGDATGLKDRGGVHDVRRRGRTAATAGRTVTVTVDFVADKREA